VTGTIIETTFKFHFFGKDNIQESWSATPLRNGWGRRPRRLGRPSKYTRRETQSGRRPPADRSPFPLTRDIREWRKAAEKFGMKIKEVLWLQGEYDFMVVAEAFDEAAATAFSLNVLKLACTRLD
jgi:hypothetical protein